MESIDRALLNLRRRQTPFYDRLYRLVRKIQSIHAPAVPGLYDLLYYERRTRSAVWQNLLRVLYYEPMFRTRCKRVGRNLTLVGGLPLLMGNPLRMIIGDHVTISGVTTFVGSKMADAPVLEIGSGSYIGYQTTIVTGQGVHIGEHVHIANRVFIAGDDSHPLDRVERMQNRPPRVEHVKEVWIDDGAWIGEYAAILKGVHIGKGAIVGAHAVVTKDVPACTVVAGNPARVVKKLEVDVRQE